MDEVFISEEMRESHFHIIGSTGEGKSKLLEWLMRNDVDTGNGFVLCDPSEGMSLGNEVLKYALSKNRKVVVFDYRHFYKYGRMPTFNPLRTGIVNAMDDIRVLFGVRDATETIRIQRYLTAILQVLRKAKRPITDALYFTERDNPHYMHKRMDILRKSDPTDRFRLALEEVFQSRAMFMNELQSTVRRFETIFHPVLMHVFSGDQLNFIELIKQKYIIILNLYPYREIEQIHTKLLGISVINEIVTALDILRENGWKGIYYLYLDEAGRFVNRNLADALAYKRKTGLRVIVSHQYFKQFEDPYILDAILNLTKVKIFFNIPSRTDRDLITKNLYGGDISDRDASWANSDLPKQTAVVKVGKDSPKRIKIPDVNECNFNVNLKELANQYDRRKDSLASRSGAEPKHTSDRKGNQAKISNPHKSTEQTGDAKSDKKGKFRSWDSAAMESPQTDKSK